MIYSRIAGTGSQLPEAVITNHDLEAILETSDQWIRERTGIRERRKADDSETTASLAGQACRKAMEAAVPIPHEMKGFTLGSVFLKLAAAISELKQAGGKAAMASKSQKNLAMPSPIIVSMSSVGFKMTSLPSIIPDP